MRAESTGRAFMMLRAERKIGSRRRRKLRAMEAVMVLSTLALIPLPKPSESTAT